MSDKVVLDRKAMRVRKCWWVSQCIHPKGQRIPRMPLYVLMQLKDNNKDIADAILNHIAKHTHHYTVEVTEEEARTGTGRACPECGRVSGTYVCDGFPTHQGAIFFEETRKEDDGAQEGTL